LPPDKCLNSPLVWLKIYHYYNLASLAYLKTWKIYPKICVYLISTKSSQQSSRVEQHLRYIEHGENDSCFLMASACVAPVPYLLLGYNHCLEKTTCVRLVTRNLVGYSECFRETDIIRIIKMWAVSKKTDTKWNSSTFCGTVPHFSGHVIQKWNSSTKKWTGPGSGSQFLEMWNSDSHTLLQ
jgi:hypothetical protein